MNKKSLIILISSISVVSVLFGVVVYIVFGNLLFGDSSPKRAFKLIDSSSGQVISNVDVRVSGDNGKRCITYPCDTNSRNWSGRSDNLGIVFVPTSVFNVITLLSVDGYLSSDDIVNDSRKEGDNWVVELDLKDTNKGLTRKIKLIDSSNNKLLVNIPLIVTQDQTCRSVNCKNYNFKGVTNIRGNVYYPVDPAEVNSTSWIIVDGYTPASFSYGTFNMTVFMDRLSN